MQTFDSWVHKGVLPRPIQRDAGAALLSNGAWQAGSAHHSQMTSFRHSRNGSVAMRIRASGINTVHARLASGEIKTYYYHLSLIHISEPTRPY